MFTGLLLIFTTIANSEQINEFCFAEECGFVYSHQFYSYAPKHETTLRQIHVLFRHGDRTSDYFYPNDPHINNTFHPYGLKELTNEGKRREYSLGLELRQIYGAFLGDMYMPDTIEARSSEYNRTKMSLQLVLAGMYPPVGEQIWHNDYPQWQPIPTSYIEKSSDTVFLGMNCPSFRENFLQVLALPELQDELLKYRKVYKYLTERSGMSITSPYTVSELYWILKTENDFNLKLPTWTKAVYPALLTHLTEDAYMLYTHTDKLKQIMAGGLLTTIWENTIKAITRENRYKVQLYSGHEINIASVLRALGVFEPHLPQYGCYIVFEIHKIEEIYYLKVKYQSNRGYDLETLQLPACDGSLCELSHFYDSVANLIVDWSNPCSN